MRFFFARTYFAYEYAFALVDIFRLVCQSFLIEQILLFRKYVPFWIEMDSNGDQMFSVTPASGELPPVNFSGQLFKVTYKPKYYGKTHTSKVIIQVSK